MATIIPSSGDSTPGMWWWSVGVESGAGRLVVRAVVAAGRDVVREPRAIVHAVSGRASPSARRMAPAARAQPGLARVSVRSTARVRRDARGDNGTAKNEGSSRASQRYQAPTLHGKAR